MLCPHLHHPSHCNDRIGTSSGISMLIPLILCAITISADKLNAEEPFWFLSCSRPPGHIIAIGYAPVYTDISKSFKEARATGVECLAKQLRVIVEGIDISNVDNYESTLDAFVEFVYPEEVYLNAKMNLGVLDSVRLNDGVYSLCVLSSDGSKPNTTLAQLRLYSTIVALERFLESSPYHRANATIGYGIGKSFRMRGNSHTDAHEKAIADYVKSCSVQINTISTDYLRENVAYANMLTTVVYEGIIEDLYIVHYWYSLNTSSFHCVVEKKVD